VHDGVDGLLTDASAEALAAALARLGDAELRVRLSAAARATAACHDVSVATEAVLGEYEQLVAERRTGR
jgi:glycosyltransferase involved in cell wall biosynthesis